MTHTNRPNGPSRDWLLKAGAAEDACRSLSVGGLAADVGLLRSAKMGVQTAFPRLVEYSRRKLGLSVEQLAEQADVDIEEIVQIETMASVVPDVRTVYQLAEALKLTPNTLMEVAGLTTTRPQIRNVALRFAARSESTARLSHDEQEALEEFVKVLVESSHGA
jgi:HTH-type transcriptional regulator, competence development regulator